MKRLLTLSLSFFACVGISNAQIDTVYYQNFNTGSASEWTLNTTDLGGAGTGGVNQWIINNSYSGGGFFTNTPDEIAPIAGYPESYYLHITSGLNISLGYPNDCYETTAGESYISIMNSPITTTGHTNDTLSFWWICRGNASAVGKVYYRTSATDAWQQITSGFCTNPISTYDLSYTTWTQQKVHIDSFDNAPFLEFAFQFNNAATGNDPSFGVDDIMLYTSSAAVTAPVASFSTTATTTCQDNCTLFTSTSTGTVVSVSWAAAGATIVSPTSDTTTICFPTAGTYSVTLTATNTGGSTSSTNVITVNPAPSPVITNTGGTLSVSGSYTSYQWYDDGTAISGATGATYTPTDSGTFTVMVDSGGCGGWSTGVPVSTGITNVTRPGANYWLSQPNNTSLYLNASSAVNDELNINIYDATGRKILTDVWGAGNSTKQINSLSMVPGLYIIKLSNSYTSTVLKWLKP